MHFCQFWRILEMSWALYSFLDCLINLVVVTSQAIFWGPEQLVVTTYYQSNCDDTSLRTVFCSFVRKPNGNKLFSIPKSPSSLELQVPYSKLHCNLSDSYRLVLSGELVVLSCSSSQSTMAWLIGDVCVSILKMCHPPSDTGGTHVI